MTSDIVCDILSDSEFEGNKVKPGSQKARTRTEFRYRSRAFTSDSLLKAPPEWARPSDASAYPDKVEHQGTNLKTTYNRGNDFLLYNNNTSKKLVLENPLADINRSSRFNNMQMLYYNV